ncbi:hypothetical protein GCM10017667_74250 [Streptomyces filamentosus]|uniref:Uncharacterized protein n=1 Tax=Streptomyces filamentosus TaxID=67294 RepID=A0A919ESM7_STRFL|nr:hypothetical protein GCM10017667_74250 [Streptomyces filamentosus]
MHPTYRRHGDSPDPLPNPREPPLPRHRHDPAATPEDRPPKGGKEPDGEAERGRARGGTGRWDGGGRESGGRVLP